MRRWVLFGIAGGVVVAAVKGMLPLRKRGGRGTLAGALLAFLLTRLSWDWNPVHWFEHAYEDAAGILKKVVRWVLKWVKRLGDDIVEGLFSVYHTLTSITGVLESEVEYLFSQIGSAVGVGVRYIERLIHDAVHIAERGLKDIISGVESFAHAVYRDASNWYNDAINFAVSHVKWFWHHVIEPAIHLAEHAGHDLHKLVESVWHGIYRDVIKPIEHDAWEAYHEVTNIGKWIDNTALDAVHLVEEAWDWLESFAKHPYAELESLPDNLAKLLTKSWITTQAVGAGSLFEQLAAELEKVL